MDQWLRSLSEGAPFEPPIVWYYSPRITSRAVIRRCAWSGRTSALVDRFGGAHAADQLGPSCHPPERRAPRLVKPGKGRTRPHRGSDSGTSGQRDDGRAAPPQEQQRPCTHWAAGGWTVTFAGSQTLVPEKLSAAGRGADAGSLGQSSWLGTTTARIGTALPGPTPTTAFDPKAATTTSARLATATAPAARTRRVGDHLRQDDHHRAIHGGGAGM
jgi:hypothetical protein